MAWKRIKKNLWYNYNKKHFLQISKVSFKWEKLNYNVVIYDSKIKSLTSSLGKTIFVKHLGIKKEALIFARNYMRKH